MFKENIWMANRWHEKIVNITNHLGNANQNHCNEILLHTCSNDYHQEDRNYVLEGKKREPLCTVCGNVNWCNHCGTVWKFLKKLRTEPPCDPTILLLVDIQRKSRLLKRFLYFKLIAALFTIAWTWKHPSVHWQMNG